VNFFLKSMGITACDSVKHAYKLLMTTAQNGVFLIVLGLEFASNSEN